MGWPEGYDSSFAINAAAEARREAARAQTLARAAEHVEILRQVRAGSLDGKRRLVDYLAQEHKVDVTWLHSCQRPRAIATYRQVIVAPLKDDRDFATVLHEIGHVVIGDCPGREPHLRTAIDDQYGECLHCEILCWKFALASTVFTPPMVALVRESLASYAKAPAWASTLAEFHSILSPTTFMRNRHEQFVKLDRYDRQRAYEAECARDRAIEIKQWEAAHGR